MLLRLAYLGVTDAFALLRLLPPGYRDKDIEILSSRHQLAMLQGGIWPWTCRMRADVRCLIRDRDGKYPALFDTILADAGIKIVRSGVQMHRDERDH